MAEKRRVRKHYRYTKDGLLYSVRAHARSIARRPKKTSLLSVTVTVLVAFLIVSVVIRNGRDADGPTPTPTTAATEPAPLPT